MRSIAILPFGQTGPRVDKISNMVRDQQTIIRLPVMAVMIVPSGWIAKERM